MEMYIQALSVAVIVTGGAGETVRHNATCSYCIRARQHVMSKDDILHSIPRSVIKHGRIAWKLISDTRNLHRNVKDEGKDAKCCQLIIL